MSSDFYSILGVARNASLDEIKKRYKKLAVKYHPDKTKDKTHHDMFLLISEAYETLKDDALRRKYNLSNGIVESSSPRAEFHSSYTQFRHGRDPEETHAGHGFFGGGSYFTYFQKNARAYKDAYERSSRQAHEDNLRRQAELAAHLAHKKMEAELASRREEFARKARQQRKEEELRQHLERELYEQKQRQERAKAGARQGEFYNEAKFDAYQRVFEGARTAGSLAGKSFTRPIVVDDDETDRAASAGDKEASIDPESAPHVNSETAELGDSSYDECRSHADEEENSPSINGFVDQNTVPPTEPSADANVSFQLESTREPEIVEVSEESEIEVDEEHEEQTSPGPSKQPREKVRGASVSLDGAPFAARGAKKARLSNFDGMKATLGANFEDVDFSDIRSTLPDTPHRTRKASSSVAPHTSKRARFAEFSNGTSRAQTVFTPVNKLFNRRSLGTISVADLSPEMDDSTLVFEQVPPTIKITPELLRDTWNAYCKSLEEYERNFTLYRKSVLEYQTGRLEKDERHHAIIFSDTSCLGVHQSCMFNDVLILQNYTRALQEFRQAFKLFQVNCEAVKNIF